jgi:hypothetical protein
MSGAGAIKALLANGNAWIDSLAMRTTEIVCCCIVLMGCGRSSGSVRRLDGSRSSSSENADSSVEAGKASFNTVCDGSPSLRLRIYQYSSPERNLRGSIVRIENGFPSFGLDGECNYYINGGWLSVPLGRDEAWRYGKIPSDVQSELDAGLILSNLQDLRDCLPDAGLYDVDPWVISTVESSASCISPGPKLSKALAIIQSRASSLWSNGLRMEGPIRFSAADTADDSSNLYQWPLVAPLADFVIREDVSLADYKGFSTGVSYLTTDQVSVVKFRQLREQYIADRTANPGRFTDGQVMSDGTTRAFVYMRDALPYEDEHGLWPF